MAANTPMGRLDSLPQATIEALLSMDTDALTSLTENATALASLAENATALASLAENAEALLALLPDDAGNDTEGGEPTPEG